MECMTPYDPGTTLPDLLHWRIEHEPDQLAFRFLGRDGSETSTLNYAELGNRVNAVAAGLANLANPGDRVLILLPPGPDYVAAFFGCLTAGMIAVTAYPPSRSRKRSRLEAIVTDSAPSVAVASERTAAIAAGQLGAPDRSGPGVRWLITESLPGGQHRWARPAADPAQVALLQYTSGSTATPKGVMVSHRNLMHNSRILNRASGYDRESRMVSWLPPYHDMGLVGGVIAPVYGGFPGILLSPATFAVDPFQWLSAISRYRGTVTYVPNFALDFAVERITPPQRSELDLSCVETVGIGAEPIRARSLSRFAEAFADCGFRPETLRAGYGMAETTLIVTATQGAACAVGFAAGELARGEVRVASEPGRLSQAGPAQRVMVSCGASADDMQRITIVDRLTAEPSADNRVGEIWLSGPSVAMGYWNRTEETARTFGARLADGTGPYLRTGDLGFFRDGELFVAGRVKDLIIVRGRNLHPQDLEECAERSHPSLRSNASAAIGVDTGDGERLVLVAEAVQGADAAAVAAAVRRALATEFDVALSELILIRAATLLRTSSGKIQRQATALALGAGELDVLSRWSDGSADTDTDTDTGAAAGPVTARLLKLAGEATSAAGLPDPAEGLGLLNIGLDSLAVLQLVARIEKEFGLEVGPVVLDHNPPMAELAGYIAAGGAQAGARDELPQAVPDPGRRWDPFPLTATQHAYWLGRLGLYELGDVATHVYLEFESADFDPARATATLRALVARHDMLRAVVEPDHTQRVLPEVPEITIAVDDLSGCDAAEQARGVGELRERLSHEVRPADRWPLFEIRAQRLSGGLTRVHLSFDMLIADGTSIMVFLSDWAALYANPAASLPALGVTFRDYLAAIEPLSRGPRYERARAYWLSRLDSLPATPELALAGGPAAGPTRFTHRTFELDRAAWQGLKERARRLGVTPAVLLLAAYADVLARWSTAATFTITVTVGERLPVHPDIGHVIGDFTSLTLLAVDASVPGGIAARARRIAGQLWHDLENRQFSTIQVLREAARARGERSVPMPVVFTSLLDKELTTVGGVLPGLGRMVSGSSQTSQVYLDHQVCEVDGELRVAWDSVDGLFCAGVVEEMFGAYCGLLEGLAAGRGWDEGADVVPGWQRELVGGVNRTGGPVPEGLLFSGLVAQAERDPGAVAVIGGGRLVSFGELYRRACWVAGRLRELGVAAGELVGVSADKGPEQVVAAVGVLLAGGAYVPVDPELPARRREFVLAHGGVRAVVTGPGGAGLGWPAGVAEVVVDLAEAGAVAAGPPPWQGPGPDGLAYVLYTSGSTGEPKGVAVSHRAALNTCADVCERFGVGPGDRVLGVSSLSFDLSVWDVFGVLGAGGAVVLPEPGARRDPGRWRELAAAHQVTVWNSVPALMDMFTEHCAALGPAGRSALPGLRLALLSGDWIPVDLPGRIRSAWPGCAVVSLGGATEAAIWSICYPVGQVEPSWESVPYGKPLRNQTFQVLNDRLEQCPVWVTGELYIGGAGLAEGYWRDPGKTAAAFFTHPVTGERLYRTGDLGRWLPDGNIEFLGRRDSQVKIGGFRVELGEIEAVLARHPQVAAAAAAAAGDRHHRRLAAAVVPAPGQPRDPQADAGLAARLREHARDHLPGYMIPATITITSHLPLTPNGKIDRAAISTTTEHPAPHVAAGTAPRTDAVTSLEVAILAEARNLLGTDDIDTVTNFFELGIDSVHIVRIHRRLQESLCREFPVTAMFEHVTIRDLAGWLAGEHARPARSAESGDPAPDVTIAESLRRAARIVRARRGQPRQLEER